MVLSDVAEFSYKLSDFYHPEDESGILWNDERLGIQWPITEDMQIITSERDSSNLPFSEEVALEAQEYPGWRVGGSVKPCHPVQDTQTQ